MTNEANERSNNAHGTGSIDYSQPAIRPYKQESVLRELYHEQGYSQAEIGDRYGVDQSTISYWFDKHNINASREASISKTVREDGKVLFHVPDGDGGRERFYRHQIVALLDFEGSEVFDGNSHIHHEMATPVGLDIPANLDCLGDSEHVRLHQGGAFEPKPEPVLREIFGAEYDGEPDPEDIDNPLAAEMEGDEDDDNRGYSGAD